MMFNALVHTRARFSASFLFLFSVWTVVGCGWQTSSMNGRRQKAREGERVLSDGGLNVREGKRANPLFVLF
jgi:hypothetical protein